jgi:hypothetical protein
VFNVHGALTRYDNNNNILNNTIEQEHPFDRLIIMSLLKKRCFGKFEKASKGWKPHHINSTI